ncbi:phospholipase D-like domain-containing protein [Piscinibacter sakaiensis]|uniref:phospholipase D-like domain-containing protein n=1 Tax=Piscinibacter sakaiensis TaxID=1547922 RepID=UPI003AADF663
MNLRRLALCTLTPVLLAACALAPVQPPPVAQVVANQSSAGPLRHAEAIVLNDNEAAFAAKLAAIEGARQSLDLAYYIFAGDHSSSRLSQALIDAAQRGVRVRLLVDYLSAYKDLDRFDWLQREGRGRLEVRLYNRPTVEILKDAAFLTLSCDAVGVASGGCDEQKVAAVNGFFDAPVAAGESRLNRSYAGSGLFLAGLYGKHPQLMSYAVARGQGIDTEKLAASAQTGDAARTEQLKALGKLYFRARFFGGIDQLAARFKLAVIRLAFAEQVNPVFDAINGYLPLTRQSSGAAQQDWDYLTEFLHHKFLFADQRTLLLGGRNVEDSYHLNPGPLADKYIFIDTDVWLQLAALEPALATSFERLWNLRSMVATIDEVRQHAPNDLLENFDVVTAAQDRCQMGRDRGCLDRELDRHFVALPARLQKVAEQHRRLLQRYLSEHRPAATPAPMAIDAGARIVYFENLPVVDGRRVYGAPHGREAASGKHIHLLWRSALQSVCSTPAAAPRDIVFHNAYLFLPANLLRDVAAVLDGSRPCAGVTLSMLTNSLATTDLNIVNLLATWQLKALADHLREKGRPAAAASLRYFEYQPTADGRRSLHSKVMVFDRDIFIGSANADVRSLMMDTNNGIFISEAPVFAAAYHQRLGRLLATPELVAERTSMLGRDAATLTAETDKLIDQLLDRYAKERLSAQQRIDLKQQVRDTSARVYELSRRIMRGDTKAADEFNALFKAI